MSKNKRVIKKISTPFNRFKPTAAILMVNMVDPQVNTIRVFLEAIGDAKLPCFAVANKMDLVDGDRVDRAREDLGIDLLPTSMLKGWGLEEIKARIRETLEENIVRVLRQDAEGILATLEIAVPRIKEASGGWIQDHRDGSGGQRPSGHGDGGAGIRDRASHYGLHQ